MRHRRMGAKRYDRAVLRGVFLFGSEVKWSPYSNYLKKLNYGSPPPSCQTILTYSVHRTICAPSEWSRQGIAAAGAYLRVSGPSGPLTGVLLNSSSGTTDSDALYSYNIHH